ncbi:hypothetical protein BDP27DRAFT_1318232 [Rhodocollybia butyracea]|uniref:Transcription regulator Rua1 C-terminal domain-containing protein n=1 Tax=Rhodocollybia butyracea TaxID=206335 RepID=A0A9P5PWL3_9AGAR|nr:hypothetical protein BDP27DRAFT_1318232 [Rhodocollybia butyracea]
MKPPDKITLSPSGSMTALLDYSSSRSSSPSSGSSMPNSLLDNVYGMQYGGIYHKEDVTLAPSQPDASPVIHQSSPIHNASSSAVSFRLRPADFSEATLAESDLFLPKKGKDAAYKQVDPLFGAPFTLQTPEKSPTTADSVSAPSSPLTPVTSDDECISDPSSMNVKDDIPQNAASSVVVRFAQKRPYDSVASPTPLVPPKRARSNFRLALKEKEKLESNDDNESFDVPEKSLRKVTQPSSQAGPSRTKKAAVSTSLSVEPSLVFTHRTFPREIIVDKKTTALQISDDIFPLLYRRFPASTYFKLSDSADGFVFKKAHPGGTYNPPRNAFDLYTPRFVKGKGKEKMGVCPICIEDVDRGGEGKKLWLAMKFSAYNYHMQYSHGISAASALPFSPPLAFRMTTRTSNHKTEKSTLKEGKCHKCSKWVPVEGVKDVEVKVKELFWWKHAATCHASTTMQGEANVFEDDEIYAKLKELGTAASETRQR